MDGSPGQLSGISFLESFRVVDDSGVDHLFLLRNLFDKLFRINKSVRTSFCTWRHPVQGRPTLSRNSILSPLESVDLGIEFLAHTTTPKGWPVLFNTSSESWGDEAGYTETRRSSSQPTGIETA